jgi:hypothetical protein
MKEIYGQYGGILPSQSYCESTFGIIEIIPVGVVK